MQREGSLSERKREEDAIALNKTHPRERFHILGCLGVKFKLNTDAAIPGLKKKSINLTLVGVFREGMVL